MLKQLLILSGKGGTGKTTVAGAFVELSKGRAFADCDVDAPNLHLVIPDLPKPEKTDYYGFQKAQIDPSKCVRCGLCQENCAFGAIVDFSVSEFACEGCSLCVQVCPVQAISMRDHISGDMMLYKGGGRVFSTAQLKTGSGASGKLVTAVKQQLLQESPNEGLAIIDGSPGIGCPVIASISGADLVLIVAEPTISGIHDLKRIIETAAHFGASCAVCINKYDISTEISDEIERYCASLSVPVAGRIPYDETVVKAVNRCESIARYPESPAGCAVASVWNYVCNQCLQGCGS
ncbi:Electron transport complex subunit RsxB [bioreactor metagenome]|uniref:Electron transport complex subunit RsxB n=1 Tax=bioreactor metagenome TaxID=1076179 RepID=A0A645DND8_9ZZZZ